MIPSLVEIPPTEKPRTQEHFLPRLLFAGEVGPRSGPGEGEPPAQPTRAITPNPVALSSGQPPRPTPRGERRGRAAERRQTPAALRLLRPLDFLRPLNLPLLPRGIDRHQDGPAAAARDLHRQLVRQRIGADGAARQPPLEPRLSGRRRPAGRPAPLKAKPGYERSQAGPAGGRCGRARLLHPPLHGLLSASSGAGHAGLGRRAPGRPLRLPRRPLTELRLPDGHVSRRQQRRLHTCGRALRHSSTANRPHPRHEPPRRVASPIAWGLPLGV